MIIKNTTPLSYALIASSVSLALCSSAYANTKTDSQQPNSEVEVIEVHGATALQTGSDAVPIFGSVQSISQEEIETSVSRSLPELLKSRFASVNLNDAQNNPFQPDLQYRGFTASPLLGLPQGISVYMNGGRINEAFGDTVNWDLMPLDAIDTVALYSGSNPLFGQNTLGGALALNTKTGFSFDANEVDATVGQYGQSALSIESGGNNGNWGYYINANHYEEDGWRDYSPSEVNQVFSAVSYQDSKRRIDFNYLYADSELLGNGASPIELLEIEGREAVYTHPDQTNNELHHFSLSGDLQLSDNHLLSFNAFYRDNETTSINGDDSDFGACQFSDGRITLCELEDDDDDDDFDGDDDDDDDDDDDELATVGDDVEAVAFLGYDEETALSDISNVSPDEIDGTYNTGLSSSEAFGVSSQLASNYELLGKPSVLVIGATYNKGDINYSADTTFGILENDTASDSRTVIPLQGIQSAEDRVRLDVDTTAWSLLFVNTTQLTDKVSLNIGGRFNRDHVLMEDLSEDGDDSLDGDHRFTQFNPAIGLDIALSDTSQLNLAFSQSSRTPSPAELSCADEDDPCRLPNGFVADPPLNQVVTQTIEANYATTFNNIDMMLNVYRSESEDDIIFQQAGSVASRGYFINIDATRRQGVEFSISSFWKKLNYRFNYNYLDATFESSFTSFSPFNPLGANRQVEAGDTIPGQPKHNIKFYLDYAFSQETTLGAEVISASSQYFRGDEANENDTLDSYVVTNLYLNHQFNHTFSAQLRVNNVFDKEYETFGTYGEADEVLEDIYPDVESPLFVGPAQPRMVSLNVKAKF
ncbi:TonB-dependent receptor [Alteromonas stellipolaris]|uniref:TonB-dependent receptor n=1 Tax=Alteromonas stellipolaris TaxID=233316 RepID=UPI001D208A5F|nr:TonB-dependent receptor [Alteromonas stellipolaris]MBZ2163538.1 TonB-dependent receptor [Alteromonas stellipolaris]